MAHEPVVIPEKIYFKIGEVCELVGVQAHVLRYWETEFPMLSPQKNKSGQRSYRRRDVKMALRIKQLLYNEMFTIAGAKKKLIAEQRSGSKPKDGDSSPSSQNAGTNVEAPTLFENVFPRDRDSDARQSGQRDLASSADHSRNSDRELLKTMASHLLELREMLRVQH
jgi:DNA-binding transcriptional MerR regulator